MREISINGNPPDLSNARRQHLVQAGCVDFDDINKPCLNHLCQKGKCVPTSDRQTYECKCRGSFSGPFCDQGLYSFILISNSKLMKKILNDSLTMDFVILLKLYFYSSLSN